MSALLRRETDRPVCLVATVPDNLAVVSASAPGPEERLLEVASRLFYAEGIHAVGVDRVIADASVAKATL